MSFAADVASLRGDSSKQNTGLKRGQTRSTCSSRDGGGGAAGGGGGGSSPGATGSFDMSGPTNCGGGDGGLLRTAVKRGGNMRDAPIIEHLKLSAIHCNFPAQQPCACACVGRRQPTRATKMTRRAHEPLMQSRASAVAVVRAAVRGLFLVCRCCCVRRLLWERKTRGRARKQINEPGTSSRRDLFVSVDHSSLTLTGSVAAGRGSETLTVVDHRAGARHHRWSGGRGGRRGDRDHRNDPFCSPGTAQVLQEREPKPIMLALYRRTRGAARPPPDLSDARYTCCFQIEVRGSGLVLPVSVVWPLLEAAQAPR